MSGVELISVAAPGGRCEDFAAALDGLVVVLDGVTPPPDGVSGCVHDVPWFVDLLGHTLLALAGGQWDRPLADCLAEAIVRTAAAHGPTCDLSHPRTPQATVAVLRWDHARVEHLVLSDAAVLLAGRDGAVTPVLDSRLDELRTLPDLVALRSSAEAYRTAVEALRNAPGGFHTAAADPAVVAHAVTGTTPRAAVRAAAALTDGATRWRDVFGLGDWAELLALLRTAGPAALVEQVRAAEAADPDGRNFPRGKAFDDASAVYVHLGDEDQDTSRRTAIQVPAVAKTRP